MGMNTLFTAACYLIVLILSESVLPVALAGQEPSSSKRKEAASKPSPKEAHPNPQPTCNAIDLRYPDGKQVNC